LRVGRRIRRSPGDDRLLHQHSPLLGSDAVGAKHQQHACAIAYADDGYIKAKLSVALKVLSDSQQVFKEDAGLELQLDKTAFLVKGISAEDALNAADTIVKADPSLSHLASDLLHFSVSLRRGMRGSVFPSALTRLFRTL